MVNSKWTEDEYMCTYPQAQFLTLSDRVIVLTWTLTMTQLTDYLRNSRHVFLSPENIYFPVTLHVLMKVSHISQVYMGAEWLKTIKWDPVPSFWHIFPPSLKQNGGFGYLVRINRTWERFGHNLCKVLKWFISLHEINYKSLWSGQRQFIRRVYIQGHRTAWPNLE